jgi:hypothetical protein
MWDTWDSSLFFKLPFADGTVGSVNLNRQLFKSRLRVTNAANCLSYFLLSPISFLLLATDSSPNYPFASPLTGMNFRHPAQSLIIKPLISCWAAVSKDRHSGSGPVEGRSDLVLFNSSAISLRYIPCVLTPVTVASCYAQSVSFGTDGIPSPNYAWSDNCQVLWFQYDYLNLSLCIYVYIYIMYTTSTTLCANVAAVNKTMRVITRKNVELICYNLTACSIQVRDQVSSKHIDMK